MTIISLFTLVLISSSAFEPLQVPEREWVIQDVLIPSPVIPGTERGWGGGMNLGDHDFDQRSDFMLFGTTLWPSGHNPWYLNSSTYHQSYGAEAPFVFPFDSVTGRFTPISHWREPRTAFLNSSSGLRVASHDNSNFLIAIFDWHTKQQIGHVAPPAPHPTWGQITRWAGIFWAGDINQDGFDDLFLEAYAAGGVRVLGMIDGQTLTVPWTYHDPGAYSDYFPSLSSGLGPPSDLDGDGSADFVTTYSQFRMPSGQFESVQLALSGLDGHVIWRNSLLDAVTIGGNASGKDITGDGIPDFFWANVDYSGFGHSRDVVQLTDGSSGQPVWNQSWHYLDHLFPPSQYSYIHHDPSFFTPAAGDSGSNDLCQVIGVENNSSGQAIWGVAHLDPMQGTLASFQEFPANMLPWFPEPANTNAAQQFFSLLGDIDRDGFVELFHSAETAEFDDPNIPGLPAPGMFYSQKTLFTSDTVSLGYAMQPTVSIPTASHRPCTLLLSTAFDKMGGLMIGEWRTHLAPSRLLQYSLANRPWSLTLDANGEGSFFITVPPKPGLLGRTIYSRAVVQEALGSQEIWTLSTLGQTIIQ